MNPKERIVARLSEIGVSSLSRLDVEVVDGVVRFRGIVRSFYERQLCLSCQHMPGVRMVVDELKVETLPLISTVQGNHGAKGQNDVRCAAAARR